MPKKVFELAKEFNLSPLDLVEDLKKKGFNVRNHMAEMSDADINSYLSIAKIPDEKNPAVKRVAVKKKNGDRHFKVIPNLSPPPPSSKKPEELKYKLGEIKAFQDLKHKEIRDHLHKLESTPAGRQEILKKYKQQEYVDLIVTPSLLVMDLYEFQRTSSFRALRPLYSRSLSFLEFNEERIKQIQGMAKTNTPSWDLKCAELAVGGEVFANHWAESNGLTVSEVSAENHFAYYDSEIDGKKIDIKTRQQSIVGRKQNDLPATRWDGEEVLMFIQAKTYDYNSTCAEFKIIGIFDGDLIKKYGFSKRIEACSYFTAPFFLDIRFYFKKDSLKKNWPLISVEDMTGYLEKQEYQKIVNHYGGHQYFEVLAYNQPKFSKLFSKLAQLYKEEVYHLAPLAVFDFLLALLETRTHISLENASFLEAACLKCIELNEVQKDYLEALLKVANEITHRKCRFTGLPLNEAPAIRLVGGILFAAYSDVKSERNSLLAYSRYSGELLVIGGKGVSICQDVGLKNKECACLVHMPKDQYFGRSGCPEFGVKRDIELVAKKLGI